MRRPAPVPEVVPELVKVETTIPTPRFLSDLHPTGEHSVAYERHMWGRPILDWAFIHISHVGILPLDERTEQAHGALAQGIQSLLEADCMNATVANDMQERS